MTAEDKKFMLRLSKKDSPRGFTETINFLVEVLLGVRV
jgi:hypothetical protein